MPLNKAKLIQDIKDIKNLPNNNGESNTDAAIQKLADAIEAYVKSGDVQGASATGGAVTGKVI
jgi:hypothetical protein